MSCIVLTGGPGAGKTKLLLALQACGYTVVADSARAIIQERRRRGLSPRPNAYAFAQEVLRLDIENYHAHAAAPNYVFFERSVIDALCMLDQVSLFEQSELSALLSRHQYHSKAFILPPWEAIYTNDAERDQTFEEAEFVYKKCGEWYRRCGYRVIVVPRASVAERCSFVLEELANSDA